MNPVNQASAEPTELNSAAVAGVFYLTGIFFLGFWARLMLGPLMPVIEKDLNFSHMQAGTIFFCISSGYTCMLLISGYVAHRFDHHKAIVLSAFGVATAMLLVANAPSLNWLRAGGFVAGMAAGLYFPSGMASLTNLVPRHKVGWALGIHEWAPNLALILAPLAAEFLLSFTSWRAMPLLLCGLTLIMGFVFLRLGPGRGFKGQSLKPKLLKQVSHEPMLWAATMVLCLSVATSLGSFAMLPLYLVFEQGVERSTVNLVLSVARIGCMAAAFYAGVISDRIGAIKALTIFLALSGVATFLLGSTHGNLLWVIVFIQPLFTVCLFAPSFALLTLGIDPQNRNVAVAVSTGFAIVVGAGLFPTGIGYLGEQGQFGLAFMLMGVLCLCGMPVLMWLGRKVTN